MGVYQVRCWNKKGIICLVMAAFCMAFIFGNSLLDGELSAQMSGAIVNFMQGIMHLFGVTTAPTVQTQDVLHSTIRSLAHVTEFAAFSFFLAMGLYQNRMSKKNMAGTVLLIGLLVGVTDELIQGFTFGRSSAVADVCKDFLGVVIGLGLAMLLCVIIVDKSRMRRRRYGSGRI